MRWCVRAILAVSIAASASEAHACSPIPPEPPLAGESTEAYRDRVEALERVREAQRPAREAEWLRQRQADNLEQASMIFIARNTPGMPLRRRSTRLGRPIPLQSTDYLSTYYTPVAWLRGPQTRARFRLQAGITTCGGLSGIGDTTLSEPGAEFIFFAIGVPFTELTLIDAIAIDRVTDPTLLAFVAQSRQ
jgi:hypothetical protein